MRMTPLAACVVLCVPCAAWFASGVARAAPSVQEVAQLGSLQRTAASLDEALDVYRLALVELVPALRSVLAAGQQPGALPTSPVPSPSMDVFKRLSVSVHRRVGAQALPALPRAYHTELVAALEDLAGAQTLGAVPAPTRALVMALDHLTALADDVVDVFSRQRPVLGDSLDPGTALDDINEALQQLALAEANIGTVRAHHGAQGEQLQAFLRLEIALGHALDLIAAAEESGVHIGFELARSTVGLSRRLTSVHKRLDEMRELAVALAREPRATANDLRAALTPKDKDGAEVVLQWTPPDSSRQTAQLRIYRRNNLPLLRQRLVTGLRCEGKTAAEAESAVHAALAEGSDALERVVELPPGRSTYVDALKAMPMAPPLYRIVAVSAFGIESKGTERAALALPVALAPAALVQARAQAPEPDSPAFYRDADAVTVNWLPSTNDVTADAAAVQFAESRGLPLLMRYNVFRISDGKSSVVGHVPAGITQFIDRPAVEQLRKGVQYTVQAMDARGGVAQATGSCAQSSQVRLDLQAPLTLASAGAAYVTHPTRRELARAEALREPSAQSAARADFLRHDPAEQELWRQRFWYNTPAQRRVIWYQTWTGLLTDAERTAWLASTLQHVHSRDEPWLHAEIWLAENPAIMGEVDRWWELLDEASRKAALQAWRARLNRAHLSWLQDRMKNADARQRQELERPARVLTWWQSRDGEEQERLLRWWNDLTPEVRVSRVAAWLHGQPKAVLQSIRWPDWDQLTAPEREDWLRTGYRDLPSGLWPQLLAYVEWQELDAAAKARAIVEEVGVWRSTMSQLRFMLRPLDLLFDFKLVMALLVIGLGALSGFLLQYAARHQLGDPPES